MTQSIIQLMAFLKMFAFRVLGVSNVNNNLIFSMEPSINYVDRILAILTPPSIVDKRLHLTNLFRWRLGNTIFGILK